MLKPKHVALITLTLTALASSACKMHETPATETVESPVDLHPRLSLIDAEHARYKQDLRKTPTYCNAGRDNPIFGAGVEYRLTEAWWRVEPSSLVFTYKYEGGNKPLGAHESPDLVITPHDKAIGSAWYQELRKQVSEGSVSVENVRKLVAIAYEQNGYVRDCQTGIHLASP